LWGGYQQDHDTFLQRYFNLYKQKKFYFLQHQVFLLYCANRLFNWKVLSLSCPSFNHTDLGSLSTTQNLTRNLIYISFQKLNFDWRVLLETTYTYLGGFCLSASLSSAFLLCSTKSAGN
jgi:hypothetical protein